MVVAIGSLTRDPGVEGTRMPSDGKTRMTLGLMLVPVVFGLALLTSGCNTMRGMGEDVGAAGDAMSDTAEDTEEMMEEEMKEE
jgi:predicted small secreted protein